MSSINQNVRIGKEALKSYQNLMVSDHSDYDMSLDALTRLVLERNPNF